MFYIDNVFYLLYIKYVLVFVENFISTIIHSNPQVIHYSERGHIKIF
jgi:hypothetical protein